MAGQIGGRELARPAVPLDIAGVALAGRAVAAGARGQVVFPGRLDKALLSFGERAMVTAMRAPLGDFRDWEAIRTWAERIATELLGLRAHEPGDAAAERA